MKRVQVRRRRRRKGPVIFGLLFSSPAIVAAGVLALVATVVPWHPSGPTVYDGFDSNLMYVDQHAGARSSSEVSLRPDRLTITPSQSGVSVHLISSEDPFAADFDVTFREVPLTTSWR